MLAIRQKYCLGSEKNKLKLKGKERKAIIPITKYHSEPQMPIDLFQKTSYHNMVQLLEQNHQT